MCIKRRVENKVLYSRDMHAHDDRTMVSERFVKLHSKIAAAAACNHAAAQSLTNNAHWLS